MQCSGAKSYWGTCGGRVSFRELKYFEGDIFSKCRGTQWASGYFSLT